MPTRAEVTAYARAQNLIVAAAKRDLNTIWLLLGDSVWDADKVRRMAKNVFPSLVAQYGDAAATLAAEWFEQQIGERAVLAAVVPEAEAIGAAMTTLDPIYKQNPSQTLALMGGVLDRMVKQPGRDTIRQSAKSARVRWARVPTGATTCGFCTVLASQGAVYASEETADGGWYHSHCDCVATPFTDGAEYPKGYDPDALYEEYNAAASAAGTSNMKRVLSVMRQTQGVS